MSLDRKLENIPLSPGVYFFKNIKGDVIYIGKAKVLRKRIKSYFNSLKNKDTKTKVLVKNISDLEWLVVDSEVEALLTEANLIKEYKPRYNVILKDDKTFPYIRITNEPYPRVEIIRQKNLSKDDHNYYGPFTDAGYLREILRVIHKIFPLRTCTYFIDDKVIKDGKIKICLDYHIKRCDGPCEGFVSENVYREMISQIKLFLRGKNNEITTFLNKQMLDASSKQNYEDAARYRDQLNVVNVFINKQKKISQDFKDRDVIVIDSENSYGIGFILRIRNGHIVGRERFNLKVHGTESKNEILAQFILQYYSSTIDVPEEILIEYSFDDLKDYEIWLKGARKKNVRFFIPQKGEKKKIVKMACKNVKLLLAEAKLKYLKRKELLSKPVLDLQDDLEMDVPPRRIEAFDNSNIQGSTPVAGMVCFIDGKPKKSKYRKFHIKTVEGIDDFASMHEVISRRYSRQLAENSSLPDLILIDGGKGQLSAAKSALDKLGLGYLTVIGLAKRLEEVFKPGISEPQNIAKNSAGLHLLRRIRDEVHRYAITFHRKVRNKSMTKSIFHKIQGMGEKRINILWNNFNSLDEIKNTTIEIIRSKTGFSNKICSEILECARSNN